MSVSDPECLCRVTWVARLSQATRVRHQVGQCKALGARQLLPDPQSLERWIDERLTVIVGRQTENDLYNRQRVTPATRPIISLVLVNLAMATSRKTLPAIHVVE
jgi:hypothetical protein